MEKNTGTVREICHSEKVETMNILGIKKYWNAINNFTNIYKHVLPS